MRSRSLLVLFTVGLFVACAETEDPAASPEADSGAASEGGKTDGASSGDGGFTPDDGSTTTDASKDAATDTSSDSTTDGTVSDSAPDAIADVSVDAPPVDAPADVAVDSADGGCPGAVVNPTCVPPAGNFAFCGIASATSVYSQFYEAAATIDGSGTSSWYTGSGACPSNTCPGETIYADVTLNMPRTVGRVKLFGNRDSYPSGYDVLTARVQLLDAAGTVLHTADVTTSRGGEPNGDANLAIAPAKKCVKTVRVILLTGESEGPGLAEIEAFAN